MLYKNNPGLRRKLYIHVFKWTLPNSPKHLRITNQMNEQEEDEEVDLERIKLIKAELETDYYGEDPRF
jgi:hypothetical protein